MMYIQINNEIELKEVINILEANGRYNAYPEFKTKIIEKSIGIYGDRLYQILSYHTWKPFLPYDTFIFLIRNKDVCKNLFEGIKE